MTNFLCRDCELGNILNITQVVCTHLQVVKSREDTCHCFVKRSLNIVDMLDEIAKYVVSGNNVAICQRDGTIVLTVDKTVNINQIEVMLRLFLKSGKEYIVCPI